MNALRYFRQARLVSVAYEERHEGIADRIASVSDMEYLLRKVWPSDMDIRETFMAMYLNRSNEPLAYSVVSVGGIDSIAVDHRLIFSAALNIASCTGIALAHNHPSGRRDPGTSDIELTANIKAAADVLRFDLVDHLILTPGGDYYSFREKGKI